MVSNFMQIKSNDHAHKKKLCVNKVKYHIVHGILEDLYKYTTA